MKPIYLDYAATTPLDPEVFKEMKPYFSDVFANPSSIHRVGQYARAAIDQSRASVAHIIGAKPHEIIFTPSATAANNLAIRGFIDFCKTSEVVQNGVPHIVTSAFEHESVLETVKALEINGEIETTYISPTKNGFIRPEDVCDALQENTVLVSIMYANNEIGTIQSISAIAETVREARKQKVENRSSDAENSRFYFLDSKFPLFHTDAVQAFQFLDCDTGRLGVDMLTLSAHKVYGPKGVGVLYKKESANWRIEPLIYGGGQEFGFVSGTENTVNVVGCAKALGLAFHGRHRVSTKIGKLLDYLWKELKKEFGSDVELNGSLENRLPNNLNVLVKKPIDPDVLRVGLSEASIAVSFGSACAAHTLQASHVLFSIGKTHEEAMRSFRISLGKYTKRKDLDNFVAVLRKLLV